MRRSTTLLAAACLSPAACAGDSVLNQPAPTAPDTFSTTTAAAPTVSSTTTTAPPTSTTTTVATTTTTALDLSAGVWALVPHDEAAFGGED